MAAECLVQRGGQELGPMGSEVLKQLAATGQLKPTDRVRKTSMDRFVRASSVKGLFPSDAEHPAPVAAEEARPAPHHEKTREPEVPTAPVAAKRSPVPWSGIGIEALVRVAGLFLVILVAFALGHRGGQDSGTGAVAGGPEESAPPAIAGAASQPTEAAPQGAGDGAPVSADQLLKSLNDLKVATEGMRAAPNLPDELSDELRALPPDKAVDLAYDYLEPGQSEANKRTAFLLARNAANAGNGKAMICLAWCYDDGLGTPASPADALLWTRKSAETGEPRGMYLYSVAIREGLYDGLGQAAGMAWLNRSAQARYKPAVDELNRMKTQLVVGALGAVFSSMGSNNGNRGNGQSACKSNGCDCEGFKEPLGDMRFYSDQCRTCDHIKQLHRR
jgi:TPR repeat protein